MPVDSQTGSLQRVSPDVVRATIAQLTVVFPRDLTWTRTLVDGVATLGRADDGATPGLGHVTVSRVHATITWDAAAGAHVVVDRGSRNGTGVDGVTVAAAAPVSLHHGAVVRLGDVLLVYERHAALAAAPASGVSEAAVPGASAAIRQVRAAIARAAADPSPVLVEGETGTGKEFVVRELHRLGRPAGKLVPVNCAALPRELAESTLFGHVRGAFTGATTEQPGVFRAAHGGTLFLDEIGELALDLQAKLLRAVQDRVVTPVGATTGAPVDVRVVAATNRVLAREVEARRFRRDLYARLALWRIRLPPLRERRRDLLAWLDRLHARWAEARGVTAPPLELSSAAAELLLLHPWPDNLRGLDRLVHALTVLEPHVVQPDEVARELAADLAPTPPRLEPTAPPAVDAARPRRRQAPTADEMRRLYAEAGGSVARVARALGVERRQAYRWLDAYGLRGGPARDQADE